ncbi:MAG: tRNA pseudouridine(55) synthase [Kiritimatiellae bacterium]|nr:tRNA pseudouridine(55) synthase [Kiritimatiellia bacterium]
MANLNVIASNAEIDGVLVVDKPAGIAVHDMLKAVKTHFNLVKVGHGGTIAPNASGVVALLLGGAARLGEDQMGRDAEYELTMRLGRATNTFDAEGEVVREKDFTAVTRERLEAALEDFRGDIFQRQPQFSVAMVHEREGYTVVEKHGERPFRLHHIYRLDVEEFAPPLARFFVRCTKGANMRALANDLGEALGCGAIVETCRRTKTGGVSLAGAIPFMELMKTHPADLAALVKPMMVLAGG